MNKKMKIILIALAGVIVLAIAGLGVLRLSLESIIDKGVETIGPKITGTKIKLDGLKLSLLRGELSLSGFELGNPDGFSTAYAIKTDAIFVKIRPSTLLSSKIVVEKIAIHGVKMSYEQGLTSTNLTTIKGNVDSFTTSLNNMTSSQEKPQQAKAKTDAQSAGGGKKLQVNSVEIDGISVAFALKGVSKEGLSSPVPPIKLENLGTGPEGITPADLGARMLDSLLTGALSVSSGALSSLKDAAGDALDSAGKGAGAALDGAAKGAGKAVDSVINIFK